MLKSLFGMAPIEEPDGSLDRPTWDETGDI